MSALLDYLDDNPVDNYVVVFDDLKRLARDTAFHLKLRREFDARGAKVECRTSHLKKHQKENSLKLLLPLKANWNESRIGDK